MAEEPQRQQQQQQQSQHTDTGYPDLLTHRSFVVCLLLVLCFYYVSFVILQPLCPSVPGNCSIRSAHELLQQLMDSTERLVLLVAVGDFSYLFATCPRAAVERMGQERARLVSAMATLAVAIITAIIVAAALSDADIRAGMNVHRLLVFLFLLLLLFPPLVYGFAFTYSKKQRAKSAAIVAVYVAFLIANAIAGSLHVHHWTWSFLYCLIVYPPRPSPSTLADAFALWARLASAVSLGILYQGLDDYGSRYYYVSASTITGQP